MQTHEQALIECKEENVNLRNKSTTFQRKVRRSLIEINSRELCMANSSRSKISKNRLRKKKPI